MAYPVFYPFKTRVLNAVSSSSNGFMTVAVPARAKYVSAIYAPTPLTSHTAATNTCEVLVNNSVVVSSGTATAVATTTGTLATIIPLTAATAIYVNPGDVLTVQLSSCVGGNMSFVLQEF